ncbi:RNA polymerase factor sigma-54 [Bacillus sp. T33-2]|uniref:RNA polymerase factor sigma-54 n=1 Tax=Bacillus sp. T33-2 TaxID=2054168 RepID=UPI000C76026F|nr:RNA polymerase factor sigma-54 [Bacillus sp. T33-2]PLR99135.1 RNA polymerase sigma-54 factor [Bacillus sp. T33-2]
MDLKAGLWQKQTLKLTMTQELSQAIALLQYSFQELAAFLENKAVENPLLQVDYKNVRTMDPRLDRIRHTRKHDGQESNRWIEQIGEKTDSLEDYLLSQLNLLTVSARQKQIIIKLIECIDENGYLCAACQDISAKHQVSESETETALAILQSLEPAGIAARSLAECLLLQLERKQPSNELAKQMLSEHFVLFAEKKWKSLAKIMNTSLQEIQKVYDEIQTLDPRPGSAFQIERPAYIVPDIIVSRNGDELSVSVFDDTVPRITFNEAYYQLLSEYKDDAVKRFLHEKQQDYQWIMKSLEQRKETLMKVALKILEKQREFFLTGPDHLKPMTMREVAEELDVHESTVSRAVREKYIQTQAGTYELKSFFTSSVQTVEHNQASSHQVKVAIGKFIKEEDKQKPLSDQEIVHLLKEHEGTVVSRRTVAKYREQLGIPSSTKRKRFE